MFAHDFLAALDPVETALAAGITPDPWQSKFLRSAANRVLLNCSRQSGKSTITGVLSVHEALYTPNALVLLLSPTLRQSGELFRKALSVYRALDKPIPSESETALSLTLKNGSRIVSLPGAEGSIRGFSAVTLLCCDEAAWIPDELYLSVRPMLAVSGGRLIALSTPNGDRGWWYRAWHSKESWERFEVPATDCPRISPEFLEEERRSMSLWEFEQEYMCQFGAADSLVFKAEDIDALLCPELEAWNL